MPELPAPVVVSRGVVGLAQREEPLTVDEDSGVRAGRNGSVALQGNKPKSHGAALDGYHFGNARNLSANTRCSLVVDGDVRPHGRDPGSEVTGQGRNGCLLEKSNDPGRSKYRNITAAEGNGRVLSPDNQVGRSGGADLDLHIGQTVSRR